LPLNSQGAMASAFCGKTPSSVCNSDMSGSETRSYFGDAMSGIYSLLEGRPYNEQSEEKEVVFPIIKNTFIHFQYESPPSVGKCWKSSPGVLLRKSFHSKHPKMEASHWAKTCNPCAYYLVKEDGCRAGENCRFCHLCKASELKKSKKEHARWRKQEKKGRAATAKSTRGDPLPVGPLHRDVAGDTVGRLRPSSSALSTALVGEFGTRPTIMQQDHTANQPEFASSDYNWKEFETTFKQAVNMMTEF